MKKYYILCILYFILVIGSIGSASAAYQQQGFNQFKENTDGSITFWCETSCIMLLGEKGESDVVRIDGTAAQGNGMWGYGYLLGQSIYAATMLPPSSYEWAFADDPTYRQLPKGDKQIVFLVSGPVRGENVRVGLVTKSFGEKISSAWKKFWGTEKLAPYSINLRYGPMVGGWTWPLFALVMSLIATAVVVFMQKQITGKKILTTLMMTLVVVMIVGGARVLWDNVKIAMQGKNDFVIQTAEQKTFFELGDYITVTDKVRNELQLDNIDMWRGKSCSIYAKAHMEWPFVSHWGAVYLRPCTLVQTGSMADYALFYNVPPTDVTGEVILSGSTFTLYNLRP